MKTRLETLQLTLKLAALRLQASLLLLTDREPRDCLFELRPNLGDTSRELLDLKTSLLLLIGDLDDVALHHLDRVEFGLF